MRIRDWFADHFGAQYAVPRVKPKGPRQLSKWENFFVEFVKTTSKALGIAFMAIVWGGKNLATRDGKLPVAALLLIALLCAVLSRTFSFLI